jgi:hypothetical protein
MKRIGSLTVAALTSIAIWSMGPMGSGTGKAYAQDGVAVSSVYRLTYFDVATAFVPSVGGYGGPGQSGGTGDALLRIVNDGSGAVVVYSPMSPISQPAIPASRDVCANIYVFNDVQELQECCSCPLTPNSLLTFSVINDLTSNPLNQQESLSAGVIKIVGSVPADSAHCSNQPGFVTAATFDTTKEFSSSLHAWINHTETMASNQAAFNPPYGFVTSTSVASLDPANLVEPEHGELLDGCAAINAADHTGTQSIGICKCGLGD